MPNEIFWQLVSNMLPEQGEFHNDLHTHYTFFQDGDQILCRNEAKLNALVDLFDDIGLTSVTGYYDPEEDKKNNCVDSLTGFYFLPAVEESYKTFPDFSLYLAPDAVHGVGLGTGTRNYVNAFTQYAQWPQMAINFIESRIGLQEKSYDLNQTMNSW